MGLENNVALVALVVSLSALLIALGQFGQQLLGTAEGYRRCGQGVIEPWHRLRWRHWVWTEFRYETHYVTPIFALSALKDLNGNKDTGPICLKDALIAGNPKPSLRILTWVRQLRFHDREDAAIQAPFVLSRTVATVADHAAQMTAVDAKRSVSPATNTKTKQLHEEDGRIARAQPVTKSSAVRPRIRKLEQSQNQASWIEVLRRLYAVYRSYESELVNDSTAEKKSSAERLSFLGHNGMSRFRASRQVFDRSGNTTELENDQSTQVSIDFMEGLWDILPSDVSKPLAKTTLGAIVIFGLRMDMQWRELRLSSGYLPLADGNGYSITFQEIAGIGLVARLSQMGVRAESTTFPLLTPGRATDKLMCGIIPGCKYLVDQDIPCVFEDRKEAAMAKICELIAPRTDLFKLWKNHHMRFEPQNEAVTLMCEFLPVSATRATKHCFWGWRGRSSVFTFYEGAFKFRRHLRKTKKHFRLGSGMEKVLDSFDYLEDWYPKDFYALNGYRAVAAQDNSYGDDQKSRERKQQELLTDCRGIFDWTTFWLLEQGFDKNDTAEVGDSKQTLYMRLVAAHCRMSIHAVDASCLITDQLRKTGRRNRDQKRKIFDLDNDRKSDVDPGVPADHQYFDDHVYGTAEKYIELLDDKQHGVVPNMLSADFNQSYPNLNEDTVRTAWWVLMLRGVVATMSTQRSTTKGDAIPSFFYENDTPVWIT